MIAYRTPDGMEQLTRVVSAVSHSMRVAQHRARIEAFRLAIFGTGFVGLVIAETTLAAMMFSLISIEIMGNVVTGATYALMVPIAIGAAHVKIHHEGDHFTKWWLKRLTSIGLLFFAVGISLMVGFSAFQAAQDAVSVISTGPTGSLGTQDISSQPEDSGGISSWLAFIPNSLLFLGLSFGMIITIYLASFFLGKALQAFNILTLTPRPGGELTELIEKISVKVDAYRMLRDEDEFARMKRPSDMRNKFARVANAAAWNVVQDKKSAAHRKFLLERTPDPLAQSYRDPDAESIPSNFKTEAHVRRHLDGEMDVLRQHNILRILDGFLQPKGE
ncbi:hypothetical protein NBRC116601_11790 [Cognatishimia sp. WU-CL00825]|uniref:hypothetical protein n=1 Tax=Cognatishimia sp. WU-CL00825 TaxID=3127658 RepID=UPI003106460D